MVKIKGSITDTRLKEELQVASHQSESAMIEMARLVQTVCSVDHPGARRTTYLMLCDIVSVSAQLKGNLAKLEASLVQLSTKDEEDYDITP